jgi:hypothetical protein
MKKKCALILAAVLLLCSSILLVGCSDDSDVPSGMQLVYGSEADGYFFYAPEEWSVSNTGQFKSAYISRVNTTSVTFAEVFPKSTDPQIDNETYFFTSYLKDSLAEAPETANLDITIGIGEAATFGKAGEEADKALKFTYNYDYAGHKFGFMQIFVRKGERFFIFQYCAVLEEKSEGKTYYDYYMDKMLTVCENFRFVEKKGEVNKPSYKKDADGFLHIGDADLSGFDLFAPESFSCDYSSAMVSATHADGSNINMSEALMTGNNMTVNGYWELRKTELAPLVGSITEIEINKQTKIGNSDAAFSYEYTYVYNGTKYHVLQIYAIEGPLLSQKGYVFTYTAKEENYSLHLDEVNTIIKKVHFE